MRTAKLYAIASFLAAVLVAAAAVAETNQPPRLDYRKKILDNGLTVITLEDFSCPVVAVQVWYGVGSKDEAADRQGYAHMFEHMMFKGTDIVGPQEHFERIQQTGGQANGYTSFDRTVYEEMLPAGQIETALWLEAERMAFLKIDQQAFDTERKVVEEELRMKENEPYGNVFKKLAVHIFKDSSYRWTPIGKIAHLRATSVADLRSFWQRYYTPNNATLVIVGAVKHSDAQKLAETYFGWIKRRPDAPKIAIKEPMPDKPQHIDIDDENAPAGLAGFIWRTAPRGHRDEIPLDFLARILGQGKSSRLYRKLVADKQIAVDVAGWTYNLRQDGVFVAGAMLAPSSEYDRTRRIIAEEIEKIRKKGISAGELEKVVNQALKELAEGDITVESRAKQLAEAAVIIGDVEYVNQIEQKIRGVSAEDIKRVANKYLDPDMVFIVNVRRNAEGMAAAQKDSELSTITAEPEKQAPPPGRPGEKRPDNWPKTAPVKPVKAEKIELPDNEKTLKNGLKIMVIPDHKAHLVNVKLGLPAGAFTETSPGTANLAMQMLTDGTKNYSQKKLARELERYAITLAGAAEMDCCKVEMSCLSEQTARGVKLLAEVIQRPRFAGGELEKLRSQTLTALAVQEQSPQYIVERQMAKQLYGHGPYGRMTEGTAESIRSIKAEQLKKWWKQYAQPAQAVLIFAGDIEPPQAFELVEKYMGRWKGENRPVAVEMPQPPQIDRQRIYLIDRPGAAQAQICIAQRAITRKQRDDYYVSRVVTNYFGGSFNSRLNENLRIKQGLTYSVWGYYKPQRFDGDFEVQTFTKNDSAAQAVQAVLAQIDRLKAEGPSPEELDSSKRYLIGSFVLYRQSPRQLAEDLWMTELENLGKDYFDKLLERIADTTAADCLALVEKTIDPQKMVIAVAGDGEKIKAQLEKIAPVEVIACQTPAATSVPGRR